MYLILGYLLPSAFQIYDIKYELIKAACDCLPLSRSNGDCHATTVLCLIDRVFWEYQGKQVLQPSAVCLDAGKPN